MKKLGTAVAAMTAGIGIVVGAGIAQARSVEVEINTAPPADRVEVVPAPRPGYVYERGHYAWDGHAYVWTEGRFIEERPGHVYTQPMIEHRGEHFVFRKGHWDDD
jgi:hypothetical protein